MAGERALRGTVLIVEDEPIVGRTFARWVESKRWGSRLAGTKADAVRALDVDLSGLIVDVNLPDGSGLDVADVARARARWVPILVVTGHHDSSTVNRAQTLGAEYAMKPDLLPSFTSFLERCAWPGPRGRAAIVAMLRRNHRLSPSESRIVAAAIESSSHEWLVQVLGVSPNTLKTQIRSLLSKTSGRSLESFVAPHRALALRP